MKRRDFIMLAAGAAVSSPLGWARAAAREDEAHRGC